MKKQVTHDRQEEAIEAKARWFQSLSIKERAELLNSYTDMILEINPKIVEQKGAQSAKGRICIVSKA
jgi:hypothetical protein